jgi:hypothetical protein
VQVVEVVVGNPAEEGLPMAVAELGQVLVTALLVLTTQVVEVWR